MSTKEKLKSLAKNQPPAQWMELEEYKQENRAWMDKSMDIALRILDILDEKNMSQNDLAVAVEVSRQQISKILKGHENLTLKTISKIETVLNVTLIELVDSRTQRKEDKFKPVVIAASSPVKGKKLMQSYQSSGQGMTSKAVEKRDIPYKQRYVSQLSDLVG